MIQVFADGRLAYDNRLEKYDLIALKVTTKKNAGGTATITMPAGHPAYGYFQSYKTLVTIYRDGVLLFRGRALYPENSFHLERTIVCEGELCFLRDSINRPYSYQESTPARIFRSLVRIHNEQVDPFKQFTIGKVSDELEGGSVTMNNESAEQVLTTLNKMLDLYGGHIVFTDAEDGSRAINWLTTA